MRPHCVGLEGADSGRTVLNAVDPHDAVAMLMDAMSNRHRVAPGDVFTVDVKVASPLTLVVPFKAAIEPGTQVKACR